MMMVQALVCGCENWTSIQERERKNETSGIKFLNHLSADKLHDH